MNSYAATRHQVETYFDKTATRTWEALTSDERVSGIRATVRAGRDRMRELMLAQLPDDLRGMRILDAGCGTGAMTQELVKRGADEVVAVDISPALINIAKERTPEEFQSRVTWVAGDMLDDTSGGFDHVMAMDSLIYYALDDVVSIIDRASRRTAGKIIFTTPPRTPALMAMWRIGKLFPRADRSPVMQPQRYSDIANGLKARSVKGNLREIERIKSGFYISNLLTFQGAI